MKHNLDTYNKVMELYSTGSKIHEIIELTGLSRNCISGWVRKVSGKRYVELDRSGYGAKMASGYDPIEYLVKLNPHIHNELRYELYSYILGMYLGDGTITKYPRTKRLVISLDVKYPKLVDDVAESISILMGKNPTLINGTNNGKPSYVNVAIYNCNLGILFPHEGSGPKHLRKIQLSKWQLDIIDHRALLRGLIMSDGSFCIRRSTNRELYNFTNCSDDISDIVKDCLTKFNITFNHRIVNNTNSSSRVNRIEISHRSSVEKLKELIGTKDNIVK